MKGNRNEMDGRRNDFGVLWSGRIHAQAEVRNQEVEIIERRNE